MEDSTQRELDNLKIKLIKAGFGHPGLMKKAGSLLLEGMIQELNLTRNSMRLKKAYKNFHTQTFAFDIEQDILNRIVELETIKQELLKL